MSLGTNIKKYRRELGLTQEELAAILNVTTDVFPFGPKPFPGIDDWFAEIKRQATQKKRMFTYAYWANRTRT